jgi:hypothetical protein
VTARRAGQRTGQPLAQPMGQRKHRQEAVNHLVQDEDDDDENCRHDRDDD